MGFIGLTRVTGLRVYAAPTLAKPKTLNGQVSLRLSGGIDE